MQHKCQTWNKHNTYLKHTNLKYYDILTYHHFWRFWIGITPRQTWRFGKHPHWHVFPFQVFQVASAAWRTVASGNRQTRAPVHQSRWHRWDCFKHLPKYVPQQKCDAHWTHRIQMWRITSGKKIHARPNAGFVKRLWKVCATNTPPFSTWSLRIPCHPGPRITAKRSCSVHRDDARTVLSSHVWARPANERVTQPGKRM